MKPDCAPHCERDHGPENCETEITPEMIEAGLAVLYDAPGLACCGVDFDATDLVSRVYLAMAAAELAPIE